MDICNFFVSGNMIFIDHCVNAAAESLQKGTYIDPCSPKGYLHHVESSPGSLAAKIDLSTLQAGGNFSECRSAALTLLQNGKG